MKEFSGKWSELSNSVTERYLDIMVLQDLSWDVNCEEGKIVGMLNRRF